MFNSGPDYLRRMTNMVLDALLRGVREGYAQRPLAATDLERIVEATRNSTDLDHFYRASFDELMRLMAEEQNRKARVNAFGRLIVHPLEPLFESGELDRRVIGNFFFFVRSLFGEQLDEFAEQAATVAEELQIAGDKPFDWQRFYADPRMKRIYYTVMQRVVRAFRVFETRKDWVMKVMQHDPTTVSLSSTVYIERSFDGQPLPFGDAEFYKFFDYLVRPLGSLEGADKALFAEVTGEDPAAVFGGFLRELQRYKPAR